MSDVSAKEKGTVLVFAVVATVLLIELGFRLLAPAQHQFNNVLDTYPDNPRGYFDRLSTEKGPAIYGVPMNTSDGLGGRPASKPGEPTILGLGDSQAMGQGVRYEDTLYARLGENLGTSVRNVAVRGYDLDEVVSRYAYEARDPGQYEWVVYALVLDDFGLDRTKHQRPESAALSGWRTRSATINFFAHIAEQWALSEATTAAYLQSYSGENFHQKTAQIRDLRDAVQSDDARLLIVVWPLLYDFETYPFQTIHDALSDLMKELEIPMVDGLSVLNERDASSLWVHAVDHHPNEIAHRLMADAVSDFIRKQDSEGE